MRLLLTGWLGAGCTEVANIIAKSKSFKVVNSYVAIKDLIKERGIPYQTFEQESRSGEYDLDVLLRNKVLEYLDEDEDLIIEGRAALLVLDRKFDLTGFLTAPKEERVRHVAFRREIDLERAAKVVEDSDRERRHLVRKLFDHELDLTMFDVVLNTSRYGYDWVATTILNLLEKNSSSG